MNGIKKAGVLIIALLLTLNVSAEDGYGNDGFELGFRVNALFGNGVPSNDIIGGGISGRWDLKDDWFWGAAIEYYEFDFERPATVVGITQDPRVKTIDATTTSAVVSGFVGQRKGDTSDGFHWFWTAGLGIGSPDVADIGGPTDDGGSFFLKTDASTEVHLMGSLGSTYVFNENWSATVALRLEHHFMDYKVVDTVSGNTGTISSQTPKGIYFGFNYRF